MSAMENRADGNSKRASAISALPPLIIAVATDVPPYVFTFAIRANRMSAPPGLFKMVNRLFVSLERLEKIEDVHECTVLFDALPYLNPCFCQVQKRTITLFNMLPKCMRQRKSENAFQRDGGGPGASGGPGRT